MKKYVVMLSFIALWGGPVLATECASDEVLGAVTKTCIKASGICAPVGLGGTKNCTYTIDKDGKLVVTGSTVDGEAGIVSEGAVFNGNEDVTSIDIKGDFSLLGANSFAHMPNVTSIKIGDGVQVVGSYAFAGNSATEVSIGKVERVGSAFLDMSNLKSVSFSDGDPVINTYAFSGSGSSEGISIALPEGLTKLENYALGQISNVTSIVIPDSLVELGYQAFFRMEPSVIYCNDTAERSCSEMLRNKGMTSTPAIQEYSKEDGMYVLFDDQENKIYFASMIDMATGRACENTNTIEGLNACKAKVLAGKGKCQNTQKCMEIVENANGGEFVANGKFYASFNDFLVGNNLKKRIYTVEEASQVAGEKNSFRIRYR